MSRDSYSALVCVRFDFVRCIWLLGSVMAFVCVCVSLYLCRCIVVEFLLLHSVQLVKFRLWLR